MNHPTIAFIGGGNMATSLIGGLIADGWPAQQLIAADPIEEARANLEAKFSIRTTARNEDVAEEADVLVLAVKPQVMVEALETISASLEGRQALMVSIAAGVPIEVLSARLGDDAAIVRVMPNTPALIGQGMSVLYANARVSAEQRELSARILAAAGDTLWVDDEDYMHAVTALSGSGPAYFFYLLEALIAAGEQAGLPADVARELALKTGQGATAMALGSHDEPSELRRKVTSPGGTTERALEILRAGGFEQLVNEAIAGATLRSRELTRNLES